VSLLDAQVAEDQEQRRAIAWSNPCSDVDARRRRLADPGSSQRQAGAGDTSEQDRETRDEEREQHYLDNVTVVRPMLANVRELVEREQDEERDDKEDRDGLCSRHGACAAVNVHWHRWISKWTSGCEARTTPQRR